MYRVLTGKGKTANDAGTFREMTGESGKEKRTIPRPDKDRLVSSIKTIFLDGLGK